MPRDTARINRSDTVKALRLIVDTTVITAGNATRSTYNQIVVPNITQTDWCIATSYIWEMNTAMGNGGVSIWARGFNGIPKGTSLRLRCYRMSF